MVPKWVLGQGGQNYGSARPKPSHVIKAPTRAPSAEVTSRSVQSHLTYAQATTDIPWRHQPRRQAPPNYEGRKRQFAAGCGRQVASAGDLQPSLKFSIWQQSPRWAIQLELGRGPASNDSTRSLVSQTAASPYSLMAG
jgi:hypothetical protein